MRIISSLCVVGLALGVLTSAGCGSKADPQATKLVGVWEGQEKPEATVNGKKIEFKGEPLTIKVEFKANGAMIMTIPIFDVPMNGTWKLAKAEGNKLTIDTVIEMPSFNFAEKIEDGKASSKTEMKTKKEPETFTVVFETNDKIVMTPSKDVKDALTLHRKK